MAEYKTWTKELYDPDLLRKLYLDDGLTLRQIGQQVGVSPNVVGKWLKKAGIERRPGAMEKLEPTEAAKLHIGRLAGLQRVVDLIDAEILDAVQEARLAHASWHDIGQALRITQSSAHGRYSDKLIHKETDDSDS